MPKLSMPRFYEGAVHEFLGYLDTRIENKELEVVRRELESILCVPKGTPRFTLIVRADCGVGEFLWFRRCTYPEGYRGMTGCLMDDSSKWMSGPLFAEFCAWARWFMGWYMKDGAVVMDWDGFNAEGRRLARCLKAEVGLLVRVIYCKSHDDPGKDTGCCLEMPHVPRVFSKSPER